MKEKLGELEKVISQAASYISRLQKEKKPRSASQSSDADLLVLKEENSRLKSERKEARKRVRAIIREIDKVKW